MQTKIDDRLVGQVRLYRLRFTCEHCGHFDQGTTTCSLGYPNEPHRSRDLTVNHELEFCKEFELV